MKCTYLSHAIPATAPAGTRLYAPDRTLRRKNGSRLGSGLGGILGCILLSTLLGACSSVNSSARIYAEQNENAIRRQQAEQDLPRIDNQKVYLDMIREMQERSLYFASLAHIDAYLKTYESIPEIQRLRADALRATDQPDAAKAQYTALLSGTQAAAAWHGLGLLAGQRGDYPAAVTAFREAIQRDPTNAGMLNDLGYALMQSGDRGAARLPLMQAIELMPDNRKIVSNLALYLLLSNQRKNADGLMARAEFSPEVKAEIVRQAARIGVKDLPAAAASKSRSVLVVPPVILSSKGGNNGGNDSGLNGGDGQFMQPMLQRFGLAP